METWLRSGLSGDEGVGGRRSIRDNPRDNVTVRGRNVTVMQYIHAGADPENFSRGGGSNLK